MDYVSLFLTHYSTLALFTLKSVMIGFGTVS